MANALHTENINKIQANGFLEIMCVCRQTEKQLPFIFVELWKFF